MTFEKSFFLYFLVFTPAPFLIYFLIRAKKKKIKFPSLIIFRNLNYTEIRKINYLKYLVFSLRTLLILFLVLSFTGLHFKSKLLNSFSLSHKKQPLSMVIMLDTSYSMDAVYDKPILLENISAIKKILSSLDNSSRVSIISFSENPTLRTDFVSPEEAIKKIENWDDISYGLTNYGKAFSKAIEILKNEKNKKVIFLASDNSVNGMLNFPVLPSDILVVSLKNREVPLNFWFENIKVFYQNPFQFKVIGDLVSSRNFTGKVSLRYCNYSACGNWRNIFFNKEQRKVFEFIFNPKNDYGYLEISKDALLKDNKFFICFPEKIKKILVLYSGKDIFIPGKGSFFIKEMFDALKTKNLDYEIDYKNEENFLMSDLKDYSMIIAVISYNETILQDILSKKIPFLYIPEKIEKDSVLLNTVFSINGKFMKGDYVLSGDNLKENIYVKEFYATNFDKKAFDIEIISENKNRYPAILKINDSSYFFTFSIDIKNSNLAVKPLFMNLLTKIIPQNESFDKTNFFIGEKFLIKENGSQIYFVQEDNSKKIYNDFVCKIPGIYMINSEIDKTFFSCNIDGSKKEGSLEKIENPLWKEISGKEYLSEFENYVYAADVSFIFLLCAILILLLENFILWKYF